MDSKNNEAMAAHSHVCEGNGCACCHDHTHEHHHEHHHDHNGQIHQKDHKPQIEIGPFPFFSQKNPSKSFTCVIFRYSQIIREVRTISTTARAAAKGQLLPLVT